MEYHPRTQSLRGLRDSATNIHLGRTACLLCRQAPTAGEQFLDVHHILRTAPDCSVSCQSCLYTPNPGLWFHKRCYDTLIYTYEPAKRPTQPEMMKYMCAIKPAYQVRRDRRGEISSILEGLRRASTGRLTQPDSVLDLFMRLPMELKALVAELTAPCWYLTVLGEGRRLLEEWKRRAPQPKQLTLQHDVWMRRIHCRGIPYVTQLSTAPLEATATSRVHHLKIPLAMNSIVLSLDAFGLRGIQFIDKDSVPDSDESSWYKVLRPRAPAVNIKVECNDLFVQDIALVSDGSSSAKWRWSTPVPPAFQPWNAHSLRKNPRLDYVAFDANVKGLLACCTDHGMMGFHGFSDTATRFKEFLELMHWRNNTGRKVWIYFPLNQQETITAAWTRRYCLRAREFGLVLQTSLGRTITFAPPTPHFMEEPFKCVPLVKESDGPINGVFHDGLDPARVHITAVGVTCSDSFKEGGKALDPQPEGPRLEPPRDLDGRLGLSKQNWFMTKAPLQGLVKVQVCRDPEQPHHPVSGLLLVYDDEHIESLGQVRWEYGFSEEVLMPAYVETGAVDGRDCVKSIRSAQEPGVDSGTEGWRALPLTGTIVWWFYYGGDQIAIYD
ncbi:uncharacterized protein BO95DRAFT_404049 [Aspergillus brunneoviolaceus CBS 621.78]|uniref:Uncharacterized protein n=1 Tax=Aspergillus brunneoviolaceus CBS 621.78 TaxID=1450534 RepID=A0ACD1GMI2_9EURO|nr:hypothetical protein BO95DRAFT_404049 [Aspergillus brunneoviolaceus CBS 621.78]RAH50564.1 hypothetical protein BO95DRAFT_404049 [Aspergillus brunneoviolaceus CBS 621.78]